MLRIEEIASSKTAYIFSLIIGFTIYRYAPISYPSIAFECKDVNNIISDVFPAFLSFFATSIVRIWIHLGLIPSADVSLYIWALDYLFFNLLTWGTLLFLGFVFNCVPRCLLFLILYLPLRIYAGGFHAKTKIGCYLISAFTFLFVVLYPADTTIHFYHLVFPCISTCIIYYFSPVSATNKPLDDLEALHYKKMARKILFSEILFFLLILLIFNTQITFAFFFSFTIHLSVLALQITVELVSKNFFANL